jgi:tape measure domain-containing protein
LATKTDELIVLLRADISGLQAQLAFANQNITNFRKKAESDVDLVGKAFQKARTYVSGFLTAYGAFKAGSAIIDAGVQMQMLTYRMNAATGSSKMASDALAFVRSESDRLGLSFVTAAEGFAGFSASALRSGMTLQQTKDVFSGVSEAITAMHLPADRAASAFLAIEQMASKTTVQMQELKLQLAQAIPGAMETMAASMGKSNQELNDMMSKGQLLAKDALPALARAFHEQFGTQAQQAAEGAQSAFNRFGNAFFDLKVKMADTGFLDAITDAARRLTDQLNDPSTQEGLTVFAKLLGDIASAAVTAASAIGKVYGAIDQAVDSAGDSIFSGLFGQAGTDALARARRDRESRRRTGNPLMDNASTSTYKGDAQLEALLAEAERASSGGYTLGGGQSGMSEAQRQAQERIARQREQLSNRVSGINQSNYGETDPAKAAVLEWQQQQKELEKALEKQAITKEQYRQAELESEIALQDKLTDIRKKATDLEVGMRGQALDNIAGLLNVFAGKNKAVAIAMLAFDKARLIAQAIMETHVAAVAALKYDPTGATSARIEAYGYANVAAIAATGIAQLATMGASGSSSGSGGGGSVGDTSSSGGTGGTATTAPVQKVFYFNAKGKTIFSQNDLRDLFDQMNEALGDNAKLYVSR